MTGDSVPRKPPASERLRAALDKVETARTAEKDALDARDDAILDLHYKDGMRSGDIAREYGLSKSNVVRILERNKPR